METIYSIYPAKMMRASLDRTKVQSDKKVDQQSLEEK
jgi:hypothetical protein